MTFLRYLFNILIPSTTAYLANSNVAFDFLIRKGILSDKIDITTAQECCLCVSILFTVLILTPQLVYSNSRRRTAEERIVGLYNMLKLFVQTNLAQISNKKDFDFEIRIFVRELNVLQWLKNLVNKKKETYFVIRNITPFAKKDITEHLRFRVSPEPQGLVGSAYKEKSAVYDPDLINSVCDYRLDELQKNRTADLQWSICVPVIDAKNNVVAVVAFDSLTSKLDIESNEAKIRTLTNTFTQMMYDSVEVLFKRKVGFTI